MNTKLSNRRDTSAAIDSETASIPTLRGRLEAGEHVTLAELEEAHIRRVITSTHSLQEAADVLGIDQSTLWRRRKHYGI